MLDALRVSAIRQVDTHTSSGSIPHGRIAVVVAMLLAASVTLAGCRHAVRGQPIPEHVQPARWSDFTPEDPDVVVLHYYGVGGWGILWKGSYLLAAPYFSNHDLWDSGVGVATPDRSAIERGFEQTPIGSTRVILIGHGHVDHASDVPAYPDAVFEKRPALIADESTVRLLGDEVRGKVRAIPLPAADGVGPITIADFRILPMPWAHAPHLGSTTLGTYLTFGPPQGTQQTELREPPAHGGDWLVGRTWAYLIELLDEGRPVFRIHYVDSAANPSFVAPPPPVDAAPVDVHIACMPNFDLITDYPEGVIERWDVEYVLAGHWEDFFRSREKPLRPVRVLDGEKMGAFITRVEGAIGAPDPNAAPINKRGCVPGETCGPSGASWTVPVPGETFWFRTGRARGAGQEVASPP